MFKTREGAHVAIGVSTDIGKTWRERIYSRSVPTAERHGGNDRSQASRNWATAYEATPRWVEPLAGDARGDLYLFWTQVSGVWLARSTNQGLTWATWRVAESEGDTLPYYPYLVARGAGELAAAWFSGAGASLHWQTNPGRGFRGAAAGNHVG